jgi:hypothetical protein
MSVLVTRTIIGRPERDRSGTLTDSVYLRQLLARQLAFRGYVREADTVMAWHRGQAAFEQALVSPASPERNDQRIAGLISAGSQFSNMATAWWSARGDSVSLLAYLERRRERGRADTTASVQRSTMYDTLAALAHLALIRGDSTEALTRFLALPDTLCLHCDTDRLTRTRLMLRAPGSDFRRALYDMSMRLSAGQSAMYVLFALERGRVAERLGEHEVARSAYTFVIDAWSRGDPEVQPSVSAAREGLARLGRTS